MGKTPSPSNNDCNKAKKRSTSLNSLHDPASMYFCATAPARVRISCTASGLCVLATRTTAAAKGTLIGCSTTLRTGHRAQHSLEENISGHTNICKRVA